MFKAILSKLSAIFMPSKASKPEVPIPPKAETDQAIIASNQATLSPADAIPGISAPVWRLLVERQTTLKTDNYALQMLLSWAWSHPQANHSEAEIANKIKIVHIFFRKNQHILQSEIKQLLGA